MDWSEIALFLFVAIVGGFSASLMALACERVSLKAALWVACIGAGLALSVWWMAAEPAGTSAAEDADAACRKDYKACTSQEQLVDIYSGLTDARTSCKRAARQLARYGDVDLPFDAFGSYFPYEKSIQSGKISLLEDGARYQNGFGAMQHVQLKCYYDLDAREIIELSGSAK